MQQLGVVKMSANMRYLAVDDDPAFHFVLTKMMTHLGYQPPVCAVSAVEALNYLSDPQQHFDAILLDIQMPGFDGFSVVQGLMEVEPPLFVFVTLIPITRCGRSRRCSRPGCAPMNGHWTGCWPRRP